MGCLTFFNGFLHSTGISDYENELSFEVFPNPANNQITVQHHKENMVSYHIDFVDQSGRVVKTHQSHESNVKIPTDDLHQGLYTLRVFSNQEVGSRRIMILK